MNKYQNTAFKFKNKILKDINSIFEKENNSLILSINGCNLLESDGNCIKSSTVVGYCLEELICKKLIYNHPEEYKRIPSSTQRSSYDLVSIFEGVKILVNLKVCNPKNSNNALSAAGMLFDDYKEGKKEKLFLVFKTHYKIEDASIKIKEISSFYLGQINFKHLKIDKRSWSDRGDKWKSGRLQYNPKKGLKEIQEMSYDSTVQDFKDWVLEKIKNNS